MIPNIYFIMKSMRDMVSISRKEQYALEGLLGNKGSMGEWFEA